MDHHRWLQAEQSSILGETARAPYAPSTGCEPAEECTLLLGELNHRVLNLLANVEALVRQTRATAVDEYRNKLLARLGGLRRSHEMTAIPHGVTIELATLIEQTVRPYCERGQIIAAGSDIKLEPKLALTLHLVIHELSMNAHKYGALSSRFGSVRISWACREATDDARQLAIMWTEHGGPAVKKPMHSGFGSQLIARALEPYGQAQLHFDAAGLICRMMITDKVSSI